MDEFAQSRGDDDLFDDEIVPVEPSAQPPQAVQEVTEQIEQVSLNTQSAPRTAHKTGAVATQGPSSSPNPRGRRGGRDRGRGNAGAREHTNRGGLTGSKYASKTASNKPTPPKPSTAAVKNATPKSPVPESPAPDSTAQTDTPTAPASIEAQPPPDAPSGPANPTPSRPSAVRGDRTKTGGAPRQKLTEEQLNEKLAAAKERSQNLAAAHARAQADADSFAERERIAGQKRRVEEQERKVLEGEREKNRERKLRGQGGREWDSGKAELDFNARGPPRRRTGNSAQEDEENDLSMYEWHEDRGRGRGQGRGRGGRGRGGPRGGGGRGGDESRGGGRGRGGGAGGGQPQQKQPDLASEFPALPSKPKTDQKPALDRQASEAADAPLGSWADQVESSEAANS